jgi:hypothetical protein
VQVIGVAFIIVASFFGQKINQKIKLRVSYGTGRPKDTLNLAKTENFAK